MHAHLPEGFKDPALSDALAPLLDLALKEDVGTGDITTDSTIAPDERATAKIIAKEDVVVCGGGIWAEVMQRLAPVSCSHWQSIPDGTRLEKGGRLASLRGPARALLTAERVTMNLICHLTGIATLTASFVSVAGDLIILDTRKTTPGLRALEKYAVRTGGGRNHRMGLSDAVLIKENHCSAAGSLEQAVKLARQNAPKSMRIQCEVRDLRELRRAVAAGVDAVLLDNMDNAGIEECVGFVKEHAPSIFVEASGNMNLERVASLAPLARKGLSAVSVGALTHSRPYADLSMLLSLDMS